MNKHLKSIALLSLSLALLAGCSREKPPEIVDTAKSADDASKAFAAANAETKAAAAEAAQALKAKDYAMSMTRLIQLKDADGLTAEQRAATAQAMNALVRDLRAAEQKGDVVASNVLEHYRRTK